MVDVIFEPIIKKNFKKIKDKSIQKKIIKQVSKITKTELIPNLKVGVFYHSVFGIKNLALKCGVLNPTKISTRFSIKNNPEIGKPMRYGRKGTRELHIPPFRLSYRAEEDTVYILSLYHKDIQ